MTATMQSTESQLLLFAKTSRLALFLLLSLAFVVGGLWLGIGHGELAANVTGWAAVVFFGAGAIYFARRLLVRTPILVIDREGLIDRASAVAVGRIRWDEIQDVSTQSMGRQKFLGIHVHDVEALHSRLSLWRRTILRCNAAMGFAPVNIPQGVLPMPIEDLATAIHQTLTARGDAEAMNATSGPSPSDS